MSAPTWRIQKMVPGGAGMARLDDGRVGFAEGALPGERIAVARWESRKGYRVARDFSVLDRAPERVEPACALAARGCGCDWLHAEYAAQLAYKVELVRDALTRVGKLQQLPPIAMHASPTPLGYRSRIRLHIDERGRVGYHARGSHQVLPVASCPVASPEVDRALCRLSELTAQFPRAAARFSEVELRSAPGSARTTAWFLPRAGESASDNALLGALRSEFRVLVGDEPSDELERWPLVPGYALFVPVRGFVQVNWGVNQLLVAAISDGARRRRVQTFIDLHAGVGNFTIALLAAGLSGVAVESHAEAVRAGARALAEQGLSAGRFEHSDAAEALRRTGKRSAPDLMLLDPPRAGAASVIPELLRLRPRCIAYCSCDPVTLARDMQSLGAAYVLESLDAFDMFPGTHHVETLAWLRRVA